MGRTLAASTLPALAVYFSWIRVENPPRTREALGVVALALAPALLPRLWLRIVAALVAVVGTAWIAFDVQVWELVPYRDERVVAPTADQVYRGVGDYYGVVLPFDPARHPEMHALVLLALLGFVAATALLVASRRPLPAAAVVVGGVGWPATLMGGTAAIGALALVAALSIPLVLRARSGSAVLAGAALVTLVVAGASWASAATTFAREAAVDWHTWDFGGAPARALGVRYLWSANYDGIRFAPTRTVVLRISGPDRAHYWRASTLDVFTADRWVEDLEPVLVGEASRPVPPDPLTPPAARNREGWIDQRVQVKALVDERLVAAGTPTEVDAPSLGTVFFLSGGVMRARHAIGGGSRYRVWSYVPDPSPADLAAAPARYPQAARRFLEVWGQELPPFGVSGRDANMRALLGDLRYPAFAAYEPLYEEARRTARGARSPYAAVLALESWFRREGGFRYEERPVPALDLPPLVHFMTVTRAGYCQHYAGAMAVMLRLLGIPARVAVGFTSGTLDNGAWTVTDHNAHAWVEVWFPRYGWVAFDPTPGRGTFAGTYSFASENAAAVAALARGDLGEAARTGVEGGVVNPLGGASTGGRDERPSLALFILLLAALGAAGVGAVKYAVRRARYLTKDPRAIASASRKELEAYLRDQGVAIRPSATLADLRQAVHDGLGLDGRPYTDAAGRARFGPPADARSSARAAQREVARLLRRARVELSARARLRGYLSLRSLRGWQG